MQFLNTHSYLVLMTVTLPKELVLLKDVDSTILTDIKYATADNFMGKQLYQEPICALREPVAKALARIQAELQQENLGLLVWDGYRPPSVQRKMRDKFPLDGYVAIVSNHNRGAAVDLTICDANGVPLDMPTEFDDLSKRANHDSPDCTKQQKQNREKLKAIMIKYGFRPLQTEWWHYDFIELLDASVIDYQF